MAGFKLKLKLTPEEKKIMKAVEADEYVPVSGQELKDVAEAIAARKKDATLTIKRWKKRAALDKLKAQAGK